MGITAAMVLVIDSNALRLLRDVRCTSECNDDLWPVNASYLLLVSNRRAKVASLVPDEVTAKCASQ